MFKSQSQQGLFTYELPHTNTREAKIRALRGLGYTHRQIAKRFVISPADVDAVLHPPARVN